MNELSSQEEMLGKLAADIAFEVFVDSEGTIDPTDLVTVIVAAYFMGMRDGLRGGEENRFVKQLKDMIIATTVPTDDEIMNLFFPKEK